MMLSSTDYVKIGRRHIGNNKPVNLMEYIEELEKALGKTAKKVYLPIQPGDIPETFADVDELVDEFGYKPEISVKNGIQSFVDWYLNFDL